MESCEVKAMRGVHFRPSLAGELTVADDDHTFVLFRRLAETHLHLALCPIHGTFDVTALVLVRVTTINDMELIDVIIVVTIKKFDELCARNERETFRRT